MSRSNRFASPLAAALLLAGGAAHAEVFINEIHYDNAGADVGEAIEVVATAGENLAGYRIWLYNGSNAPTNASTYSNTAVPAGSTVACGANVQIAVVTYPQDGLQNGDSDGIALVDSTGAVVQFISYEGQITAGNGPAAGMTSQNLPVSEPNNTPVGTSLQLTGTGTRYQDFTWAPSATQTFNACNNGQTFGGAQNVAPRVVSTTPAANATGVAPAVDFKVLFSETVTAAPGAFTLQCSRFSRNRPNTLTHAAQATEFTIQPRTSLTPGDACVLNIDPSKITDADGLHPESATSVPFEVQLGGTTTNPGGYYGRINTTSPGQLRCTLHQTIRGHTVFPYSGSGTNTWTILEQADEDPNDSTKILDVYRNRSYTKVTQRAGTNNTAGQNYNREHTWPNSLGFPNSNMAPYTDTHMLYLSDTGYNSDRSNNPYADCTSCTERPTDVNNGSGGGTGVYPGNSNWYSGSSFQTWGKRKGDMARAVMYMAVRYEGGTDPVSGQTEPNLELTDNRSLIVGRTGGTAYMGLLQTLLEWHQADPPDAAERARNEVIFSYQGNRNPFIDHPEWATRALFESTTPATCVPGTGTRPQTRRPRTPATVPVAPVVTTPVTNRRATR